jgi:hypothetical protein
VIVHTTVVGGLQRPAYVRFELVVVLVAYVILLVKDAEEREEGFELREPSLATWPLQAGAARIAIAAVDLHRTLQGYQ